MKRIGNWQLVIRNWLFALMACAAIHAQGAASQRIYSFLTFTNLPVQGNVFVLNGQLITLVTNVTTNATQVLITNTPAAQRTNVYVHTIANAFTNNVEIQYGTNATSLVFIAQSGQPLALTTTGGWATVTYKTNTTYDSETVAAALTIEPLTTLTNQNDKIIAQMNSNRNTKVFSEVATALGSFANLSQAQTLSNKTMQGAALEGGTIGATTAPRIDSMKMDRGLSTAKIEMRNSSSIASADFRPDDVGGDPSIFSPGSSTPLDVSAPDTEAVILNLYSAKKIFPNLNTVTNSWSSKQIFGNTVTFSSSVSGVNASFTVVTLTNASGAFSAMTVTNLQGLGGFLSNLFGLRITLSNAPVIDVTNLQAQGGYAGDMFFLRPAISNAPVIVVTNLIGWSATLSNLFANGVISSNNTFAGTNKVTGDLSFPAFSISTLAGGNNIAVPATNVVVDWSGNMAAASICGLYGGRDGRVLWAKNGSSYQITYANESGLDPTPANRIRVSSGSDYISQPGEFVVLIWYPSLSRWVLSVPSAAATNAIALSGGIATNLLVRSSSSNNVALSVQGQVNQRSNLLEWLDVNTNVVSAIGPLGGLHIGGASSAGQSNAIIDGTLTVNSFTILSSGSSNTVPATIKGFANQRSNLVELANSSGTVLSAVGQTGGLHIGGASDPGQSNLIVEGATGFIGAVTNQNQSSNTVMSLDANKVQTSIPNPTVGAGQPLIFNGTNSFFQNTDDGWFVNDEFRDIVAVGSGTPWTTLVSGVGGINIKTSSTNWGELVLTNGPTAADRSGGVNPTTTATYVLTNTELWVYVRWQASTLNSATISNWVAFGFGDTFSGQTSNGIWIQMSQPVNQWQAVTANAGAVTTNALLITATKDEWREFVWHLDQTQTNVFFYSGNRANNATIWCTNSGISLPTAACNWFFSSRRMATQTSGSATNAIDHFRVWKRNL